MRWCIPLFLIPQQRFDLPSAFHWLFSPVHHVLIQGLSRCPLFDGGAANRARHQPHHPTRFLTVFVNDILGPMPQAFLVSISAWRGSRANSQWSWALRRGMEESGLHSGRTTSSHLWWSLTSSRPAMLIWPEIIEVGLLVMQVAGGHRWSCSC